MKKNTSTRKFSRPVLAQQDTTPLETDIDSLHKIFKAATQIEQYISKFINPNEELLGPVKTLKNRVNSRITEAKKELNRIQNDFNDFDDQARYEKDDLQQFSDNEAWEDARADMESYGDYESGEEF